KTEPVNDKDLVLYFAAPENWIEAGYTIKSNLCFSAADNTWGQRDMLKTADEYNGLTVYKYVYAASEFSSSNLDKLQFQAYSGSTWMAQYVAVSGTAACDSINGKLYDSTTESWVDDFTPSDDSGDEGDSTETEVYVLGHYISDYHDWTDIDTYFTEQSDGTYILQFVAVSGNDISVNVYDVTNSMFNCVAASTSLIIDSGSAISKTYSLSPSSSRGKSVTIKGVTTGMKFSFIYNSDDNTLTVNYTPE
ncbi:MAG: hypothetical protein ACI4RF_05525, partial [Eubacterium sp.]